MFPILRYPNCGFSVISPLGLEKAHGRIDTNIIHYLMVTSESICDKLWTSFFSYILTVIFVYICETFHCRIELIMIQWQNALPKGKIINHLIWQLHWIFYVCKNVIKIIFFFLSMYTWFTFCNYNCMNREFIHVSQIPWQHLYYNKWKSDKNKVLLLFRDATSLGPPW